MSFFSSDDLSPELARLAHRLVEDRLGVSELGGSRDTTPAGFAVPLSAYQAHLSTNLVTAQACETALFSCHKAKHDASIKQVRPYLSD